MQCYIPALTVSLYIEESQRRDHLTLPEPPGSQRCWHLNGGFFFPPVGPRSPDKEMGHLQWKEHYIKMHRERSKQFGFESVCEKWLHGNTRVHEIQMTIF